MPSLWRFALSVFMLVFWPVFLALPTHPFSVWGLVACILGLALTWRVEVVREAIPLVAASGGFLPGVWALPLALAAGWSSSGWEGAVRLGTAALLAGAADPMASGAGLALWPLLAILMEPAEYVLLRAGQSALALVIYRDGFSLFPPGSQVLALASGVSLLGRYFFMAGREQFASAMVRLLEERDPFTHSHSQRVAMISEELGRRMGLGPLALRALRQAALLHDIGKIAVPDSLLYKPRALGTEERATMASHVLVGEEVLNQAGGMLREVVSAVAGHHERWDGNGYPHGWKGEQTPLLARILAVADAFEAMTSDRPYRPALSPDEAVRRIQEGAGTQFDPQVVVAFVSAYAEGAPWVCQNVNGTFAVIE